MRLGPARERDPPALLEVEDLHVAYGKAEVVHGVSFDVRAGEFVVLLGRNGAGKSTMLHAISGPDTEARAARVVFDGRDLTAATPARRSSRPASSRCSRATASSTPSRWRTTC